MSAFYRIYIYSVDVKIDMTRYLTSRFLVGRKDGYLNIMRADNQRNKSYSEGTERE